MSKLRELICHFDVRLKDAQSRSDRPAVLTILEEYKEALKNLGCDVDAVNEELTAAVHKSGAVRMDLLLTAAWIYSDLSCR